MNTSEIIKGYKGIMDLDLTNIPQHLKKDTVEQHIKDINNYKGYQFKLKPHLRYENTVERIQKMYESIGIIEKKRKNIQLQEQLKHNEKYNKCNK
jgi:hypothetical protein